ncbi:MAG: hypothetical protein GTO45_07770, partial [Candidatus Aminicenantes bacterium]|nr:hypothetical protein [Candidatus Aminicenantes bacterium]NIN17982.1 hypothetical protein [Candidatus Aminicenantes bacterium]NIN41882.1 hypothetical protein [Candidatus Aminicenantes bacterium]NIN84637.1 hypothetical protein [Candidatus Aminicenantes bacterium]NIO80802.1 hypothetical protein [Candidatus Aminicenantes bacterium]
MDYDLFNRLSQLGKRLIDLHLMKSRELNKTESKFDVPGSNMVEKTTYVSPRQLCTYSAVIGKHGLHIACPNAGGFCFKQSLETDAASKQAFKQVKKSEDSKEGRIYINKNQYFSRITLELWEYILCGYPILR